jgi:hypothetical protein
MRSRLTSFMIWISIAVLACLAISILVLARHAPDEGEDHGTVSGTWIAEHRAPDDREGRR